MIVIGGAVKGIMSMHADGFLNPHLLWVLAALPVCGLLMAYAGWRRGQALALLGAASRRSLDMNRRARWIIGACTMLGIALLALASAGPQWGRDADAQSRARRDLFVLLDLSRSMEAEQPSRSKLALQSLSDLADELERNGGHRVAFACFAAKPHLLFPFTHDTDHLRHVLGQIADRDYPSLAVKDPISGTRIGAALMLAVETCQVARGTKPIIVLISDGDDPVDDGEWRTGAQLASEHQIKVHVVGVGDPVNGDIVPHGREPLLFDEKPIHSRLNEKLLAAIADQTGGRYYPARTSALPLGALIVHLLEAEDRRETAPLDPKLPAYEQRYAWFLLPAILLLVLASTLGAGLRPATVSGGVTSAKPRTPSRLRLAAAIVLAVVCISAGNGTATDDLIRQGNDAFAAKDFEAALRLYEQAEARTHDPGLVSFNKAVSLYQLGRHRETVPCFRRVLEDTEAGPARRARAWFDLGNALLISAENRADELAEAVSAYRACLAQPDLADSLKEGARHNLEIAQLRWLKARPASVDLGKKKKDDARPKDSPNPNESKGKKEIYVPVEPDPTKKSDEQVVMKPGGANDKLQAGRVLVLPDDDVVRPLSPEDTQRTLEELARRIAAARRNLHHSLGPARLLTKDW